MTRDADRQQAERLGSDFVYSHEDLESEWMAASRIAAEGDASLHQLKSVDTLHDNHIVKLPVTIADSLCAYSLSHRPSHKQLNLEKMTTPPLLSRYGK